jgi:C1A family cysteine protease
LGPTARFAPVRDCNELVSSEEVSSNICHGPGNTTLSHSVVIVGYDHNDLGDFYWMVKNSWGTTWGD